MGIASQIAKQFSSLYFGGNWVSVNLKETVEGLTWQQATAKYFDFHTIADLVFHTNYYVDAVFAVLQGGPLLAKDSYSFNYAPIKNNQEWEALLLKTWDSAKAFATCVEGLPEDKLDVVFSEDKYGNYYRNLQGVIEHTHYHLGQIILIKKLMGNKTITTKNEE